MKPLLITQKRIQAELVKRKLAFRDSNPEAFIKGEPQTLLHLTEKGEDLLRLIEARREYDILTSYIGSSDLEVALNIIKNEAAY